mmetsp:Transcript_31111/g.29954  ORF Transcript_31111/g.29954 Transcript_31111/m.29954 type:complete len:327 (-) Transcript_31111:396-1376(-)|eukprot:CAMPEP_0197827934 /NCGR_PEP_ID=MMETSP1437-20131217/4604_1 /TAXON_ID=49252 ORGANISM="Eucampia antarctica, Strain CCMP1452" /NCGR_SAMPLE_ID=MMETSP1437 /ASSEMBLY_ACC=CAM_ASM_001096 /LENGTH=326 /DNA_ID=CAMNT_0043428961 /DNA_START=246 /DNA_END=1226 /DNA_ORIENTATION=-
MAEPAGGSTSHLSQFPPWFSGAPVSKSFVCMTALFFAISESMDWRNEIALDGDKILNEGQWYRLFLYHLTFGSIGELILGLTSLAPLMRRFEREMGSRRFATFLFFKSLPLATLFQFLFIITLDTTAVPYCGPYPQIGALLLLFHIYTPRLHPKFFSILGFDFSEKALIYAFAIQVIYSGGMSGTMFPSLAGMLAGYICIRKSILELDNMIPNSVVSFASNYLNFLAEDSGNQIYMTRAVARDISRGGAARAGRDRPAPEQQLPQQQPQPLVPPTPRYAQPQPPPPPPEEAIEQLTMMGFERETVIIALGATDNNVEAAANRLLSV